MYTIFSDAIDSCIYQVLGVTPIMMLAAGYRFHVNLFTPLHGTRLFRLFVLIRNCLHSLEKSKQWHNCVR